MNRFDRNQYYSNAGEIQNILQKINKVDVEDKSNTNILDNQSLLTLSEYDRYNLSKQYSKLYQKSNEENLRLIEKTNKNIIYNQSLVQISENIKETLIDVLKDFTDNKVEKNNFMDYINIISKGDRLLYLGIVVILLSLILFFIRSTSS
jgi:hypothetical protein